jgi:predicted RNA binding protein YcfA (HicA-like mRNA interferase family)
MRLPPTLKNLTARKMVNALIRDGFQQIRQHGSHRFFYRQSDDRLVEVVFHAWGDTFSPKARKTMIEFAGWTINDLKRLKLISRNDP